jgi:hypothetical protein
MKLMWIALSISFIGLIARCCIAQEIDPDPIPITVPAYQATAGSSIAAQFGVIDINKLEQAAIQVVVFSSNLTAVEALARVRDSDGKTDVAACIDILIVDAINKIQAVEVEGITVTRDASR